VARDLNKITSTKREEGDTVSKKETTQGETRITKAVEIVWGCRKRTLHGASHYRWVKGQADY